MSKFNAKKQGAERVASYEGAELYAKNFEEEWVNFLFSCMMQDGFYESSEVQQERYVALTDQMIAKYGPEFAAKAAVYSRNELGMRSISELTAAIVNDHKFDTKRAFFRKFFRRPDDVAEVFGAIDAIGGKRSHALVRGAGDYISSLGGYQISKYKMKGKDYNLFDLINITHAHSAAIDAYKRGELAPADTWENRISNAGNKEERDKNWIDMVDNHNLGYLALIRNLNNILDAAPDYGWIKERVCPQIVNREAIKRSLVFPYQIYTAYKNLKCDNNYVKVALEEAFVISVDNMPRLEGNTAIVLDVSGSMCSAISPRSNMSIKEVGAVYATAIMIQNKDSDFIKFGDRGRLVDYNVKANGPFYIIDKMQHNDGLGYGTDISSVFKDILPRTLKNYNRIFLISDMQIMGSHSSYGWYYRGEDPIKLVNRYLAHHPETHMYSYDLGNYHSQIVNPDSGKIMLLTSLNEKVLDMIALVEKGTSLIDIINDYSYI